MEFTKPQNSASGTTKTIYLIRHGQTDFNLQGIVQGCGVDTDLNETGRWQAQQFFDAYHHIDFDPVFVSRLKRTHQTVAPFIHKKNANHIIIPELDEINWGIMEGVVPTEESHASFHQMVAEWRSGNLHTAVEGGETPAELYGRQKTGLQTLEKHIAAKPVLVCMHGRAMRSFLCLLTNHPLHLMDDFEHTNVCLYILEKNSDEAYYRILLNNSNTHLG
ncbi:MAG: histidine phosphatase family protein [Sphingomonadales bacterium]|nr:histidine phosphatase family protein [Sphingomonadales bacterium]